MILTCFHQELTEELGELEASSDEEAMVTTRVVRRRVIIQVPTIKLLHAGTVLSFTKRDLGQQRLSMLCRLCMRGWLLPSSCLVCKGMQSQGYLQPSSTSQHAEEGLASRFTCLSSCLFIFAV